MVRPGRQNSQDFSAPFVYTPSDHMPLSLPEAQAHCMHSGLCERALSFESNLAPRDADSPMTPMT